METPEFNSMIKVFGIGGAGINMLNALIKKPINGVYYVCFDTNAEAFDIYEGNHKIILPSRLSFHLGDNASKEPDRRHLPEYVIEIVEKLLEHETKIVFLAAGMGGFTGTGIAPVVAKLCRDKGILVVGVVTTPFIDEGEERTNFAQDGIIKLEDNTDKLYIIFNDKLKELYGYMNFQKPFEKVDNVLHHCLLHTYNLLYNDYHPVALEDIVHFFRNGSIEEDKNKYVHISYKIALGSETFFKQI